MPRQFFVVWSHAQNRSDSLSKRAAWGRFSSRGLRDVPSPPFDPKRGQREVTGEFSVPDSQGMVFERTMCLRSSCPSATVERENSSVESILSFGEVCRFTTNSGTGGRRQGT